ncbi:MAG: VWA domain-containing protein [Armatimonadetes bacterium]|nr:VWA domain-containing protein [Armatimonadota bacterium]
MKSKLGLVLIAAVAVITVFGFERSRVAGSRLAYAAGVDSKVSQGELRVLGEDGQPIGQCPLKRTDVKAEISGFVTRVDVTQEFVNPLNEKIEAVYVFPLPQDSAVDRMEMTVGGRTITGDIKRREEARQIYEAAKNAGHVASLLDQDRPNIFTQSVANIMPGERVLIKISYVDILKYEDGWYEFVFPMVVGPRYIPGIATGKSGEGWAPDTTQAPDASRITPPVTPKGTRAGHDISIRVNINSPVPVNDIRSVLHDVSVSRTGLDETSTERAAVELRDKDTIPNKDFILRYQVAGKEVSTGLLPNTRAAGDGYFSLVLVPPKSPRPSQVSPKEMIFVIDSSGSQMGWPIEKAKETMKLCVDQMNPGDTFQMLAFSNDVITLFDEPRPNTAENRALAQEFLSTRLGSGGTEMLKAVIAALTPPPDPKRLRIVCFMTDGYVGNDFEILDAIKKNIGAARLFSFGIGNSVNRFLLDGMAEMGRGAVEYVTLQEQGRGPAERFHDRIAKPILTDISIDWGGLPVEDVYPERIPDLFSSKPIILKGRYVAPMDGYITISGRLGGRTWQERVEVSLPARLEENRALPSLWARARISDLMSRDLMGLQRGTPDSTLKEEITQVALEYQLMSQFTSFVAVEDMVVTEGGKSRKIAVPVEMPEGVSYEGVFGDGSGLASPTRATIKAVRAGAAGAAGPPASPAVNGVLSAGVPLAKMSSSADLASAENIIVVDSPEEQRRRIVESRLAPLLRDLKSKLDKHGNYSVSGKLDVKAGKVRVSIRLSDDSKENIAKLKSCGFELSASARAVKMVVGVLPVDKLEEIAKLDFVLWIAPVA